MAHKRGRAAFEADLQAQQSPYVFYGTPLPPLDDNVRDDGSYVPVWKQEVTDDRGRKRLHGAFTGGFSAGYFNTVGSKEGWTPSTFVSSRSNRWKDSGAQQQKAEDYMDDEDRAEAEEAQKISTKDGFSGLESTEEDLGRKATIMDLFKPSGETMGVKLLRKMGWRDGQGIGPKVWRKAKGEEGDGQENGGKKHLFAPENTKMISFARKDDRKGLGYEGEERLQQSSTTKTHASDDEEDSLPSRLKAKKPTGPRRGAFGTGILNDTGSDDEDPYSVGPRISYNRVIGGDKKKKKKNAASSSINNASTARNANPLLPHKPQLTSKTLPKTAPGFRKCHDGRLPLSGFVLSVRPVLTQENKYPPPIIPEGWKSSKSALTSTSTPNNDPSKPYQSTSSLAANTTHTPSSRGSLLGATPLPSKSVFSYLKPSARTRIADLTSNPSLPAAGSEVPPFSSTPSSSTQPPSKLSSAEHEIPPLDPQLALTALGRGVKGFIPYADQPDKLARYRAFLTYRAKLPTDSSTGRGSDDIESPLLPPQKPPDLSKSEWLSELNEFVHAATIFRPMTGSLGKRFASAKQNANQATESGAGGRSDGAKGISSEEVEAKEREREREKVEEKKKDPAEEAAALNMFGPLTRSTEYWYPTRLLCKRFDVPVPAHVTGGNEGMKAGSGDKEREREGGREREMGMGMGFGPSNRPGTGSGSASAAGTGTGAGGAAGTGKGSSFSSRFASSGWQTSESDRELVGKEEVEVGKEREGGLDGGSGDRGGRLGVERNPGAPIIDPERNEALEAPRPGEEVFKAIFGSDDEDSD